MNSCGLSFEDGQPCSSAIIDPSRVLESIGRAMDYASRSLFQRESEHCEAAKDALSGIRCHK
jgi:hypothetical protein